MEMADGSIHRMRGGGQGDVETETAWSEPVIKLIWRRQNTCYKTPIRSLMETFHSSMYGFDKISHAKRFRFVLAKFVIAKLVLAKFRMRNVLDLFLHPYERVCPAIHWYVGWFVTLSSKTREINTFGQIPKSLQHGLSIRRSLELYDHVMMQ